MDRRVFFYIRYVVYISSLSIWRWDTPVDLNMKKSKITKAFDIEKQNLHTAALAVRRGYEYFSNIIFHLYSTLLWSLWLQAGNDVSRFMKIPHLIYTLLQKPVFSELRLRCRRHVTTAFRRRRYFARSASRTPTTRVLSRA